DLASIIVRVHEGRASESHCSKRLRGKVPGECQRLASPPVVRHHPSCQSQGSRFLRAEAAPAEQQLEDPMPADDARQMRKMDRGDKAEIDLRISERSAFACDQH